MNHLFPIIMEHFVTFLLTAKTTSSSTSSSTPTASTTAIPLDTAALGTDTYTATTTTTTTAASGRSEGMSFIWSSKWWLVKLFVSLSFWIFKNCQEAFASSWVIHLYENPEVFYRLLDIKRQYKREKCLPLLLTLAFPWYGLSRSLLGFIMTTTEKKKLNLRKYQKHFFSSL